MRAQYLRDSDDPMVMKPSTEHAFPTRDSPNTEQQPKRANLRMDNVAPTQPKSKTASEAAKREVPNTENAAPTRAKWRKDRVAPTCAKSITDRDDPRLARAHMAKDAEIREKRRNDIADPMVTNS
jgi:hypothetical protein